MDTKSEATIYEKQTIPHWNLKNLWDSFSGTDYQNSIKELNELISQITCLLKQQVTKFNEFLISYLEIDNQIGSLFESLYAYSYSVYSTNTTNTESLNNMAILE